MATTGVEGLIRAVHLNCPDGGVVQLPLKPGKLVSCMRIIPSAGQLNSHEVVHLGCKLFFDLSVDTQELAEVCVLLLRACCVQQDQ